MNACNTKWPASNDDEPKYITSISPHKLYEMGWRDALEWLRNNEDAYCCGDCDAVGEWTECPKDTAIKRELKES